MNIGHGTKVQRAKVNLQRGCEGQEDGRNFILKPQSKNRFWTDICHGKSTGHGALNEASGNLAALCLFSNGETITCRIIRSGFESWLCQLQVPTVKPLDLVKPPNFVSFQDPFGK